MWLPSLLSATPLGTATVSGTSHDLCVDQPEARGICFYFYFYLFILYHFINLEAGPMMVIWLLVWCTNEEMGHRQGDGHWHANKGMGHGGEWTMVPMVQPPPSVESTNTKSTQRLP